MSHPPVPPSFLNDLDAYSEATTGMRGQYRPAWDDVRAVWTIQKRVSSDGRWQGVLVVKDDDEQIRRRTQEWFYRPLDERVLVDLMESDLRREFGTGNDDRDLAAREARIGRNRIANKIKARQTSIDTLREIAREERGLLYRAVAERQYGHSHGVRMFHTVGGV